jgi:hypothetical protein
MILRWYNLFVGQCLKLCRRTEAAHLLVDLPSMFPRHLECLTNLIESLD